MDEYNINKMALKWLFELEVLDDPTLQNNITENILLSDRAIKNCELLIFQKSHQILIFIEISRLAKFFRKQDLVKQKVSRIIETLLPSFKYRIVFDKEILTMALDNYKKIQGSIHEKVDNDNTNLNLDSNSSESELQETSNILPDQEEQAKYEEEDRDELEQRDIQNDKETQGSS